MYIRGTRRIRLEKGIQMEANRGDQPVGAMPARNDLFYEMALSLPYPVTIYGPNGDLVFVNKAWACMFGVDRYEALIGEYNVLSDPDMKRWGHIQTIEKAYRGEATQLDDVKVPLQEMVDKYGNRRIRSELLFQTISCFPLYVGQDSVPHVAVVYICTNVHIGREAVIRAKEYMHRHWMEPFDIEKIAALVYVSRYHFTRIFKKDTGMTPYEFYQDIKIERIKEKLRDQSLLICEAFAACGWVYTGSSATRFRNRVGMTPSQYRKFATEK